MPYVSSDLSHRPQGSSGAGAPDEPPRAERAAPIDLEALARCVYELLRREARVERERLGIRR